MPSLLRNLAVLALAAAWAAGAGAQDAGRVILSIGDVTIQRGAATLPAPVGTGVQKGDAVRVGASSNAQIRFLDEAIVALRPGTELKVDDYNWSGAADGTERGFFSLLKGGLRTVTGAIGKVNQQNYRVATPTSTIGIRGSNYNLVQCDAECRNPDGSPARGGTYGGVFDSRIAVENDAGERVFGVGEFFYVASRNSLAEGLIGPPPFLGDRLAGSTRRQGQKGAESSETMAQSGVNADSRPLVAPAPTPPQTFVATDERIAGGALAAVGAGFTHVIAVANSAFGGFGESDLVGANAANMVFSGTGPTQTLVSVLALPNAAVDQEGGRGEVGPGGTDMVGYGAAVNAHWGRWVDGKVTDNSAPGGTFTPPGGIHYMYSDQITPAELIAAKSGSFVYVAFAGTNPTDNTGTIGSFSGGAVNVNFTNRTADLTAAWSVGSSFYAVSSAPGIVKIHPGIGAAVDINAVNVGACAGTGGACGGLPGPIQKLTANGVFVGATGNHLPMGIATTNGTQTTSQVRLFFCPTCP